MMQTECVGRELIVDGSDKRPHPTYITIQTASLLSN